MFADRQREKAKKLQPAMGTDPAGSAIFLRKPACPPLFSPEQEGAGG